MGNSQAKESQPSSSRGQARPLHTRNPSSPTASGPSGSSNQDGPHGVVYASRGGRGSRHDLSFLGIGGNSERDPALEPRRETKAEREARKLEKERALRAQERERSIREEGVDGGYLVTLGTYTGPEDFSKAIVRQLQVERRLAPFWKGLNDHSDTWTEHQLVAVVNGLPLPAPDEMPPEEPPRSNNLSLEWNPRSSSSNINNLTVPITSRSISQNSDRSPSLSPSHPAFSLPSPTSPIASSSSPFFRGRAKTLAALTTGSRNNSQTEMTPQEIQLPKDPYVNGQRLEAFLYKNASECPICFLYYPPYLNKTRCCDQPICSECFVQIKRPDPHLPEHHDPNNPDAAPAESQEDGQFVSEPAACPFCVQPEFGVTYEPPPFRRGLSYANQNQNHLANAASAMSSSSSLNSQGLASPGRRRATSLAANDHSVITTDRVRPDWAKKLADARAHALRRAAAATALHNAAYMMGNLEASGSRGFGLGRRRRTMFGSDSAGSSGVGTPRREGDVAALLAAAAATGGPSNRGEGQADVPPRHSSRRGNRLEDLEELMMMEAIRLSLAAEEERKKKEDKEAAKEAKKEEKKKAKEAKKADKAARKSGFFPISNSTSNLNDEGEPSMAAGKGKEVDRSGESTGITSLSEASSVAHASSPQDNARRHLEQSRAQIRRETSNIGNSGPFDPFAEQPSHRSALRNLSNASSSASSFAESYQGSLRQGSQGGFGASASSFEPSPNVSGVSLNGEETPPHGTPGTEPMFNFSSLEAVITGNNKNDEGKAEHIEDVANGGLTPNATSNQANPDVVLGEASERVTPDIAVQPPDYVENSSTQKDAEPAEALEESVMTIKPTNPTVEDDEINPAPPIEAVPADHSHNLDAKHIGDISMVDSRGQEHTQ